MGKSNTADRHLLLRAALRAYPAADRKGWGDELLEAAIDLAGTESSAPREALGLVAGGVQARLARLRMGLRALDLAAGLRLLTLPVAAFVAMIWSAAAVARILGTANASGVHGVTVGSVTLLGLLALLVLGVARCQRGIATVAAAGLLLQVFCSAAWRLTRGVLVTAAPMLHLHLGPWWFGPSMVWSLLPLLGLLVPACWVMEPAAPRVHGLARPLRERPLARLVALLLPAALLGLVLEVAPQVIVDAGGETTELAGIAFLMLIVGSLWAATSVWRGGEVASTAGALAGLALVPSVAYGAARFVASPLLGGIQGRDAYVAVGLAVGTLCVVVASLGFVVVLSHVGLRVVDRRGGSPLAVGHAVALSPDDPAHI